MIRLLIHLSLPLFLLTACHRSEPLPHLFELPRETRLVTMRGENVTVGDLAGKVTIYDFIFTRCKGICPLLSQRMAQLTRSIGDERVAFASISVDPAYDTPAALARYAAAYGGDQRWMFYTGDRDEIIELSVKGFKLAAGEASPNPDEPILHSTKFVLVDAAGTIRGYYDSNDAAALETLRRDALRLARE